MREDIPVGLLSKIEGTHADPVFILKITDEHGVDFLLTSRMGASFEGELVTDHIDALTLREVGGGGVSGSVNIDDEDDTFDALLFASNKRLAVEIWGGDSGDYYQIFTGWTAGRSKTGNWLELGLQSGGNFSIKPVIGAPFVQYVTPVGTVMNIGGETVVMGD